MSSAKYSWYVKELPFKNGNPLNMAAKDWQNGTMAAARIDDLDTFGNTSRIRFHTKSHLVDP